MKRKKERKEKKSFQYRMELEKARHKDGNKFTVERYKWESNRRWKEKERCISKEIGRPNDRNTDKWNRGKKSKRERQRSRGRKRRKEIQ